MYIIVFFHIYFVGHATKLLTKLSNATIVKYLNHAFCTLKICTLNVYWLVRVTICTYYQHISIPYILYQKKIETYCQYKNSFQERLCVFKCPLKYTTQMEEMCIFMSYCSIDTCFYVPVPQYWLFTMWSLALCTMYTYFF